MLDLIEYRMHKGHVGCRKLSGHLSVDKREEASAFSQTRVRQLAALCFVLML